MKRLGIIGGIGPESTVVYYRSILAAARERLGGASPPVLINSIDVQLVLRLAEHDPVPGLRDYLALEISVLARGGASFALIAANTPHIVFEEVRQRSPIELVSIVEAARDAARERGLTRLALFGTKFTMQGRFYQDVFLPSGIELVRPTADEQSFIHEKYVDELLKNRFLTTTRDQMHRIVQAMKDRDGIDGVVLAGTELPLLLSGDSAGGLPLLDTTLIHVAAAVKRAWG
jgi:aspartate racemase